MNDKAIEYNAKLQKVENTLERMQKIGLDVSVYNNLLKDINTELEKGKESNFNARFQGNMAIDVLSMAYNKAITKLDVLSTELAKYDVYLKTASFCGGLRMFLNGSSTNQKEEFEKFRPKILELLGEIKKSDTLDYSVEGPLVEDIYHLTYEFIKLEMLLSGGGYSLVLNTVKNNEVDISFIEKEIIRELESINLQDPRYRELVNRKYELESRGMNGSYVDEKLISLIVNSTVNYEYLKKMLKELTRDFDIYYEEALSIENRITSKIAALETMEKDRKKILTLEYRDIAENALKTVVSIGTIIALTIGAFKLSRGLAKTTKYKNTTTTYSLDAMPITEEEYLSNSVNGRFLYEYEPYNEKKLGGFSREVTKFDLTNLDELSLQEYLDLDLEKLGIKGSKDKENKEELTLSDLYEETYYLLKVVNVDELDSTTELDASWILMFILFGLFGALIDICVEVGIDYLSSESTDYWGFIDGIINIRDSFININSQNKEFALKKQELKELLKEAQKLMLANEELVSQLIKAIETCDNEKQKAKINQKLERIRKLHY